MTNRAGDSEAKLAAAAAECLAAARENGGHYDRLLSALAAHPAWSARDLLEVQTRVIHALMQEMGKAG